MTNYDRGRRFEWQVRDHLAAQGYRVIRTAGSKSPVDLVAVKPDEILFVQCKRINGTISPTSRQELLELAGGPAPGIIPLVAHRPLPRRPIAYRRLTGPGPKDWTDWNPNWAVGT